MMRRLDHAIGLVCLSLFLAAIALGVVGGLVGLVAMWIFLGFGFPPWVCVVLALCILAVPCLAVRFAASLD